MNYKYLIIGGGVAGVTAAESIREKDTAGTIAIVSDEPYLLYSRVGYQIVGAWVAKAR